MILLGQVSGLQSRVSVPPPSHSAPPCAGAGFVQVLVLVRVPPPHLTEHSDHSSKSVHPPSTERKCLYSEWEIR